MNIYQTSTIPRKSFGKRLGTVATVIGAHVLAAYVLILGTGKELAMLHHSEMIADILTERKPPPPDDPLPKLPMAKISPPPLLIPMPEVKVEQPVEQTTLHAAVIIDQPPRPAPITHYADDAKGDGDVISEAWLDTRSCELPPYPWQLGNREQGTVMLLLLVDADGHVLESKVQKSSGVKLLDETARAGMARCKYKPGTVNGKIQKTWKRLRFVWQLPF